MIELYLRDGPLRATWNEASDLKWRPGRRRYNGSGRVRASPQTRWESQRHDGGTDRAYALDRATGPAGPTK